MKIQSLAIIFIIIILPITIVLSEYSNAQMQTLKLEKLYDSRLITATYDALKTFQINTFNDTQSDIADSKISSIEASVNSFYNSMESGFGLKGYSKEDLRGYTPALVYTMYDGYYIYSPYTNIAHINETNGLNIDPTNSSGTNETIYGLKPYVYYSCRYKPSSDKDSDFVITYALDNYISISGMIDGEYVKKSGYLISKDNLKKNGKSYYYNGIEIIGETALSEYLINPDTDEKQLYEYVKINGTKYYWDRTEKSIFYMLNGTKIKQATQEKSKEMYEKYVEAINNNNSAINYYRAAFEFTNWLTNNAVLKNLKASDAVDSNGNRMDLSEGTYTYIFKKDQNKPEIPFEYPSSNFNEQRKAVIRYSIESNLSVAIANFNTYSTSTNDFQMPKLKETDWELLENEVSIISFLQGLSIGGKVYNGYTVVTNEKTEEVIQDNDIYITTKDGYYHRINDNHLEDLDIKEGVLSSDFEIKKDAKTSYYYLNKNELACYTSIVNQQDVNNKYDSIYEYLHEANIKDKIKQTYYIALGRERWGTYKTENKSNIGDMLDSMVPIVTKDLIRHLEANDIDGSGNSGDLSSGVWKDLSGHYDGIVHGNPIAKGAYVQFDGEDDSVDLGVLKEQASYLTYDTIVELNSLHEEPGNIVANTNDSGLGLFIEEGYVNVWAHIGGKYTKMVSNKKLQMDTKYYIAVTYDGKQLKIYINGEMDKSIKVEGKIKQSNSNMLVGADPQSDGTYREFGKIKVYSIKIYNRALSEAEIQKNHNYK